MQLTTEFAAEYEYLKDSLIMTR